MNPSAPKTAPAFRLLVCSLLASCWTLGVAAQTAESPMLDYVDQKMIDIGAQMQNSKMRLRKDFAGVDPDADVNAQTPVVQCCMDNLERISDKIVELREAMASMLEFYRDQHNNTAVSILGEMKARLDQLTTGMVHFARAPAEARAFDALNGLIRPWNEFRNGVRTLRACCPLPIAVPGSGSDEDGQADESESSGKQDENDP